MKVNFVVVNCDGRFIEHEYSSPEEFLKAMESDDIDLPMLNDPLNSLDFADMSFNEEDMSDIGIYQVKDLIEYLKENDKAIKTIKKMSYDDLILEAELVEDEGSYYHMSLIGYSADELRNLAERKIAA